jgi:hypothetical protein
MLVLVPPELEYPLARVAVGRHAATHVLRARSTTPADVGHVGHFARWASGRFEPSTVHWVFTPPSPPKSFIP